MTIEELKQKYIELGKCIDEFIPTGNSYEEIANCIWLEQKQKLFHISDDDPYSVLLYKLIIDSENPNVSMYAKTLINNHIDKCLETCKWAKTREEVIKKAEEYLINKANKLESKND